MNKTNSTVLVLGLLIFIGILGFMTVGRNSDSKEPFPSPTATTGMELPMPEATIDPELGAGGSSYMDPDGVFSILYPSDYELDTQDKIHPRVFKRGETQRPQSEMSDGALVVFETVSLGGKSLEEWVDTRITESTADGTSQLTAPKRAITQNKYSGFTYQTRGLGESTNIVLQQNEDSPFAVLITSAISDPQQKGYQKDIESILSSLVILK